MSISQSAVSNPISTHAPAGGATINAPVPVPTFYISTHAPAGGATRRVRHDGLRLGYFYSRPCGRGDAGQSWRNLYATRISTHAPAGGATKSRMLSLPSASNFYSRPCGRGDQLFWRLQIVLHRFLLTPLREGRQDEIAGLRCGFIISTHAPAGGATHKCLKS